MGWDAYSSAKCELLENPHKYQIKDPELRKAFKEASDFVKTKAPSVDWLLEHGGLDCSDCAEMLQFATPMDCWGKNLSKKQVQEFAETAYWDFVYPENLAWAYWSARKFLETCAKLNLSIKFSW